MKTVINSEKAPAPIGPYSQAVKAGDTLYISGQIALDQATGELLTNSIEEETEQVMKNLNYVLEKAGMNMSNIVKCSIFITDMNNFAAINEVYGKYFTHDPPSRETVEVSGLPKGVNVEVSAIVFI